MAENKDIPLDAIHKNVQKTRERVQQADDHIKAMGEGAQKVGLSITGATLELNAIMKQLFLCSFNDLPEEYDLIKDNFMKHLNNLHLIVATKFGKLKIAPKNEGTH